MLGLFDEVIQEPALQQDKVALYKAQVKRHIEGTAFVQGRQAVGPQA